jgi:hypothetical protein
MEKGTVILLVGLAGAGVLALVYSQSSNSSHPTTTTQPAQPAEQEDNEPVETAQQELPPNHPPIGNTGGGNAMGMGGMAAGGDDPAAVEWKAPGAWKSVPNPNGMRLATYQVTPSGDTELVVSRAGGDVAGNIARWQGQFDGSPKASQTEKTVQGMKVTEVVIDGAFTNTMDPSAESKKDWSMLAAIVQGKGRPYFFKLVGPAATVHASKKPFDAMIDGLAPK